MFNFAPLRYCWATLLLTCSFLPLLSMGTDTTPLSDEELLEMRTQARERTRRIIYNNDGDDAAMYRYGRGSPPADENLIQDFLMLRGPRQDSQIDSVFYSTDRGSFGLVSHRTKVGTNYSWEHTVLQEDQRGYNLVPRMRAIGTDPLQEYVGFCREHNIEIFWSMRMNDTHDASRSDSQFSDFKLENPDYLFAQRGQRTTSGQWSAVDYGEEAVRDFVYRLFLEVAENYDIDGIEMDFFRHPQLFRSVSQGGHASEIELEQMTELVRKIRSMLDEVGRKKGKALLLAMRAPDSIEYCRAIGIDLEQWFAEGLIDLYIPSGYFRLNDWTYSVELGQRYGVKVYAGLSESRIRINNRGDPYRRSLESYRGRVMAAWDAGVDGIYLFNLFNPDLPHYKELGSPETLRERNRYYVPNIRGAGNVRSWLSGGEEYISRGQLSPQTPIPISREVDFEITISAPLLENETANGTLNLLLRTSSSANQLQVKLNGKLLELIDEVNGIATYQANIHDLRPHTNLVQVGLVDDMTPTVSSEASWHLLYQASELPGWPWRLVGGRRNSATTLRVTDEGLLLADQGHENGDFLYVTHDWQVSPHDPVTVQAKVKAISGWSALIISNGEKEEFLQLYPDRIETRYSGLVYPMNTTDDFHTYRIEVENNDFLVYVDDTLRIDGKGKFVRHAENGRNQLSFGAASSFELGEAVWEEVGFLTTASDRPDALLGDVILSVVFDSDDTD